MQRHLIQTFILEVSLTLLAAACANDKAESTPNNPASKPPVDLTELSLEVGQSQELKLPATVDLASVSIGSEEVAVLSLSPKNAISLTGKSYGLTDLSYTDGEKQKSVPVLVNGDHPRIPLDYFAEYNLATGGATFADKNDNFSSGYFTYDELASLTFPTGYRLPNGYEWAGIAPYEEPMDYAGVPGAKYGVKEVIEINGVRKWYSEDRYNTGKGVAYALRFKRCDMPALSSVDQDVVCARDNDMLTAYKYEYVPTPDVKKDYTLRITARYLGPHFSGDLSYVASEGFWNSRKQGDVVRILPAAGQRTLTGKVAARGAQGVYWCGDGIGISDLWNCAAGFGLSWITQSHTVDKTSGCTLRLIKTN